ncbi:hypothetical protein BBP40_001359 [Aspergillus hancockii]|nr:hypothetical protein BBP40_001359 [Aspergillus hancockii]
MNTISASSIYTFMSSWETQALNRTAVLTIGGSEALVWGIIIVIVGALAQCASLAEMASMQPIAGAQYQRTHYWAPDSEKRFITWMQGWVAWFAWVSFLAGVANITATTIQGLAIANYPDYVPRKMAFNTAHLCDLDCRRFDEYVYLPANPMD